MWQLLQHSLKPDLETLLQPFFFQAISLSPLFFTWLWYFLTRLWFFVTLHLQLGVLALSLGQCV
jgi:hypothetical protein